MNYPIRKSVPSYFSPKPESLLLNPFFLVPSQLFILRTLLMSGRSVYAVLLAVGWRYYSNDDPLFIPSERHIGSLIQCCFPTANASPVLFGIVSQMVVRSSSIEIASPREIARCCLFITDDCEHRCLIPPIILIHKFVKSSLKTLYV